MRFKTALHLTSYGLQVTGVSTLYSSGEIGGGMLLGYLACLATTRFLPRIRLDGAVQGIVFGILLTLFVVDTVAFSPFVPATAHLLMLVSLVKLCSTRTKRDYLLLLFISFAFVLIASTTTISVAFPVWVLFFLFLAVLVLMLLESKDPYEKNRGLNLALRGHLSTALLITLLLVLVSVPIFVVIPRGTQGVLPPKRISGHLSGFSEKVSLGEMGEILINEEVVLRIKVDKPPHRMPPGLKWRGIAFDHYDGKTWSSTRGLRQVARDDRLQGFLVAGRRRQEEFLIRQTIQQEPLTRVLFGLPDIILISGRLHRPYVFQDGNRSFRTADVGVRTYTIFSDVMTRDEKLSLAPVPAYVEAPGRHYLQLPELNPEVVRLARRTTAGITDPIHKAFMVEQFLKENYEYSLKNTSASTRDPLSDFLFESRAGHCEYFATAQAVLLRTLGIPTRVVNGFKRGDYNRWNGYFMVRHSDAHSWVEAYFPGREWIEFDATPAVSAGASLPVLAALRELLDAIDLAWLDVVTFDHLKQYGLFQTLGDSWKESWDSSRRRSLAVWSEWVSGVTWQRAGIAATAVLVSALLLVRTGPRFWRRIRTSWAGRRWARGSSTLIPDYYLELVQILEGRGLVRKRSETPGEFAGRISCALKSTVPQRLTEIYYRNRFGGLNPSPAELAEIRVSLNSLRRPGGI
jgi:Ca2+/Na+ antiporter